jgi:hypothetical protein
MMPIVRCTATILILALLPTRSAFAQCAPGDILVGEDESYYYCKHKAEYARCISDAGYQLKAAKPKCAAQIQQCFQSNGFTVNSAGLSCTLGCLASGLNAASCVSVCGLGAASATHVFESCAIDLGNQCLGEALREHRRAVENCKN